MREDKIKPKRIERGVGLVGYEFDLTEKTKNSLWEEIPMVEVDAILTLVRFKNGNAFTFFKWYEWNELAKKHNNRLLKKWVLDNSEREYLRVVLRPFKKDIKCVVKYESCSFVVNPYEYLVVKMKVFDMEFPPFPKGTMYQGMEKCKEYTLEELGL